MDVTDMMWISVLKNMKNFSFKMLGCYLIFFLGSGFIQAYSQNSKIIPQPLKMELRTADPFLFDENVTVYSDVELSSEANLFTELLNKLTGISIPVLFDEDKDSSRKTIRLVLQQTNEPNLEGYTMDITEKQVTISSRSTTGIYYGAMSLLQIFLPMEGATSYRIPAMQIEDQPRFGWRGLMIDCSRTFIDPEYLKKTIDRMSFYKLNKLHLHLTDDQGWRIDIKKYPLLAAKASGFAEKYNEPKEFQGYYTQEQLTDLINYAAKRHVEVIPEIESPGHELAALNAYPELSCFGNIPPIFPFFSGPGINHEIFCAGNENTYTFFEDVLNKVADVFPADYLHVGGDEAPKSMWEKCPKCQSKIKVQGLHDEEELQAYFMEEISKTVQKRKRVIAWDDILEGKPNKNWIIMVWREGQIPEKSTSFKAVQQGYDVILTPTSHLYFDYSYDRIDSKKVYAFEPIPASATQEEISHYLGIQANFWSHIDRTETRIDSQLFPRLLALSERSWSEETVTDYKHFFKRRQLHTFWMKFFDINYSVQDL